MRDFSLNLGRMHRASVLVVGDVMLDKFVYGDVRRISPEAPIPVLSVRAQRKMLGGAANVAANVAALRAAASVVGVVGDDANGAAVRALLKQGARPIANVLVVDRGRPTTVKTRYIAATQQVLRVDSEVTSSLSAPAEANILEAVAGLLPHHDIVALSDYGKGVLTDSVLTMVIAECRRAGKPVIVDPKRPTFVAYSGATFIKPNVAELTAATGLDATSDSGAEQAAKRVLEDTGAAVLLTRSEKGMSLYRLGRAASHVRTSAHEIYDVSGAGDTALAAFAVALSAGKEPEQAMQLANAAAGIAVTKRGTAAVTLEELQVVMTDGHIFEHSRRPATVEKVAAIARIWKDRGLRVGFTNGCFDILHVGHVNLLTCAAGRCDRLIVGLNSDMSVRRLKGPSRPIESESFRAEVMASIKAVDLVTVFDEDTPMKLIQLIKPDVLFKGADYREGEVVGGAFVKSYGGEVVLIGLVPGKSTTNTIRRAAAMLAAE